MKLGRMPSIALSTLAGSLCCVFLTTSDPLVPGRSPIFSRIWAIYEGDPCSAFISPLLLPPRLRTFQEEKSGKKATLSGSEPRCL